MNSLVEKEQQLRSTKTYDTAALRLIQEGGYCVEALGDLAKAFITGFER